jgi:hypothetical protein
MAEQVLKGSLAEVTLPDTSEEEELELYRRYREIGGTAIDGFEERLQAEMAAQANGHKAA